MKTITKYLTFVTFALVTTACDIELNSPFDNDEGGEKIYKIQAGQHESNRTANIFNDNMLSFQAKFDESAIYQTKDSLNQLDINKLMGFSDCGGHHHTNSARFGWRWNNDQLEIMAYCYKNEERTSEFIGTVELNSWNDYQILVTDSSYVFNLNEIKLEVERENCNDKSNYKLFPYFGGDEPAPHDITIAIYED